MTHVSVPDKGGSPFRGQVVWSADHIPQPRTEPEGLVDPHCQGSIVNQDSLGQSKLSANLAVWATI